MKWNCPALASVLAQSCTASFAQQLQLAEDPTLKEQIRKLDMANAEAIFKGDKAALQQAASGINLNRQPSDESNYPRRRPSF